MNNSIDEAYDAWKEADAAARALDLEVNETWERHDRAKGAPPSRDLMREAAWLRYNALQKLDDAIRLLQDSGLIQPSKDTMRMSPVAGPCLL